MKKLLLLIACAAVVSGAFAQEEYVGIKGGLNLANLSDIGGTIKPGFYVGFFLSTPLSRMSDIVHFQPEIQYSRQGAINKRTKNRISYTEWIRLDYINLPLLIKFNPTEAFSFELGPQLGFIIKAKNKVKAEGVTETTKLLGSTNFDLSIAAGMSYMITQNIGISARFNIGLTGTTEGDSLRFYEGNQSGKNRVGQIGALYKF